MNIIAGVLTFLESNGVVATHFKPHKPAGQFSDCWECHLKPGCFLICRIDDDQKIVQLIHTGTDADLFR